MRERFEGEAGRRRLVDALTQQKIVAGSVPLAEAIADVADLIEVSPGTTIITQDAYDNDVFFIVAGAFAVVVNGRKIHIRGSGDHVGEMAAVEPTQPRSASMIATEASVVARVPEAAFAQLAERYVQMWRTVAKELSRKASPAQYASNGAAPARTGLRHVFR